MFMNLRMLFGRLRGTGDATLHTGTRGLHITGTTTMVTITTGTHIIMRITAIGTTIDMTAIAMGIMLIIAGIQIR